MSGQAEGSSSHFRFKVPGNKAIKALQNRFKENDSLLKPSSNTPNIQDPLPEEHTVVETVEFEGPREEQIEVISVSPPVEENEPNPITHLMFGFWGDFFDFLMVTDVFSLGVGIIIGTIFTDVINSFVTDIITPPVGLLLGNAQLQNLFFVIKQGNSKGEIYETVKQALDDGAVTINFGLFFLALLRFLLVTLILFWCIQAFQVLKREQEKLKVVQKIDQQAQKVGKLIENISKPSPKKQPNVLSPSSPNTLKVNIGYSPGSSNMSPQKETKLTGLLDFLEPDDFNPGSSKSLSVSPEGRFNCVFCLKPIYPTVIRCPHCTSIINPSRYQSTLEGLKNPKT